MCTVLKYFTCAIHTKVNATKLLIFIGQNCNNLLKNERCFVFYGFIGVKSLT